MSTTIFRSKCAVTKAVDNLEKTKLVIREPIGKDRREKLVTITEKGIEFIEKTMQQRRVAANQIMSCLNNEEMVGLANLLGQVKRHVRNALP